MAQQFGAADCLRDQGPAPGCSQGRGALSTALGCSRVEVPPLSRTLDKEEQGLQSQTAVLPAQPWFIVLAQIA